MDNGKPVKSAGSRIQDASEYSLQLNRWFLTPVAAWPKSTAMSIREKALSLTVIVICYSLIAYTVVPCILNLLLEETDMHKKLKAVGPLSHWSMGGINYFSLLFRRNDIRRCVQHMKTDWRTVTHPEDREVMLRYAKFGRYVAVMCAIFMHGGVFSHSVLQGTTPTFITVNNETLKIHILPCPSYTKFVDNRYSPAGEISLTLQLVAGTIVNSITVGACSLAAVFAMHACGQLNVLVRWLDQLVDDQKEINVVKHRLADIVEHHLRVLRYVNVVFKEFVSLIPFP